MRIDEVQSCAAGENGATSEDAPVAQLDQSNSLLKSRLEVRVLPGADAPIAQRQSRRLLIGVMRVQILLGAVRCSDAKKMVQ